MLIYVSAEKADKINKGVSNRSKMKVNCHHIPEGTSKERKILLMALCPELRKKEYNKHANKVAHILQMSHNNTKSYAEQKKDFFDAIHEMARAAGHLPTIDFQKREQTPQN